MELAKLLKIDKYRLDEGLENIPSGIRYYSDINTKAINARDKAKVKLELIEAELIDDLMANWKDYDYAKAPTVAQQTAYVKKNEKYQAQNDVYLDKCSDVGYSSGAVTALQAARSAYGNLVSLHLTGYWSDIPIEDTDQQDRMRSRLRNRSRKHNKEK